MNLLLNKFFEKLFGNMKSKHEFLWLPNNLVLSSAQVTKMVIEKRKEWSKLTSLNDLTLAVCSILDDNDSGQFKRHFLQFAVEGREPEPSIASTETSEDSEDTD